MEPNKMEEEFRKKLNEREMQPSDAAWDRLDAMLSVAENKKPKRNLRWLFIAAGLALFFLIGLFLFQEERGNPGIQVKNPAVVTSDEDQKTSEVPNTIVPNEVVPIIGNAEAVAESKSKTKSKSSEKNVASDVFDTNHQIVKEEVVEVMTPKEPEIRKVAPEPEKLLAETDMSKEKPQVKINANLLLSNVEGELNQEFRETTLQRLNRNFKTVKTAVANRNYE
ncbi:MULTISPECIES: hypothetical protein [Flavobacterium]|uniref:hypothetical protein n=1 Tax=Flavobacterium TaxID=237 RepID=UPI001FCB52B9|nr:MULTISPECIES: hypothetical protein [Flavobacterium]UOK42732.1 hypothetical protein LZF87_01045 [Flavobacterium enshiense]